MAILDPNTFSVKCVNNVEFLTETFDSVLKLSTPCILAINYMLPCIN